MRWKHKTERRWQNKQVTILINGEKEIALCIAMGTATALNVREQKVLSESLRKSVETSRFPEWTAAMFAQITAGGWRRAYYPAVARDIMEAHPEKLLSVGAGRLDLEGLVAGALPKTAITAVEPSPYLRKIAANKARMHSNISLFDGDSKNVPDGKYNTVVLSKMIQYLPDKIGALAYLKDHLEPDGEIRVYQFPYLHSDNLIVRIMSMEQAVFMDLVAGFRKGLSAGEIYYYSKRAGLKLTSAIETDNFRRTILVKR